MIRCDSTKFLTDQAAALASELPAPPQRLEEHALRFWKPTIESKRRDAWTESDLLTACQLCRDLAAVEALSEDLDNDGHVLIDQNGKKYPHPAGRMLDAATRRVLAAQKHLQIHAHATQGRSEEQRGKNEAVRDLKQKISAASELIARPH